MNPELEDDLDWDEYTKPDTTPSCDRGGHAKRSLANQPNHLIFWRKQKEPIDVEPVEPLDNVDDS